MTSEIILDLRAGILECEQLCSEHCTSLGQMSLNDYMHCVESCIRDCALAKDKPARIPFK